MYCTCNVILWSFRVTIVIVKKQSLLHILSCVFVASVIHQAKRIRHVVIYGLSGLIMFLHIYMIRYDI
jgi:hypothetical protein